MLFGKVTRYIAGRGAVQTIYWRTSKDGTAKMVKTGKVLSFRDENGDKIQGSDAIRQHILDEAKSIKKTE